MSSSPAAKPKQRKISDAKQRTIIDKKKKIRSVMKGLLEEEGTAESFQQGHKNVLSLVEVLMKELQKLKNTVKKQTEQQTLLAEYITSIQSLHQEQITSICSQLTIAEENQTNLRKAVSSVLEKCEKKKLYNQPLLQASFSVNQIEELSKLLNDTGYQASYTTTSEFNELPGFHEWAIGHSNLLEEKRKLAEAEEEDSDEIIEVESEPEIIKTKDLNVSQEEVAPVSGDSEFDSELDHIVIKNTGLMPLEPRVNGYRIENGTLGYADPSDDEPEVFNGLIESNKDIPYYQSFFFGKPHSNYIVEDTTQGIFFISIVGEGVPKELKKFGTIVRHEGGVVICPRSRKKKIIQNFQLNPNTPWKEIKDTTFAEALLDLEAKDLKVRHRNKFAFLYVKEGQNQNEMFSNTEGSSDWEEFLEFMGDKIELKGWKKYNGGLDTETGTTGEHSLYLQYSGVEIMYHVSTMIPVSESDEQQVERKRHLGNDVVVLVFKEGNDAFSPAVIRSHFNSVFIVVQKFNNPDDEENTYYQVSVASREGVEAFPPFLPESPVFKKNKALRNFLVCKMINGERQTYQTNEFRTRLARARTGVMKNVAKDFLKK